MFALASAVLAFAAPPAEVPWSAPRPLRSRPAVRVVYGTIPCELPVREARVTEGRRRVVVTLVGQTVPPGTACAEVMAYGCVEVRLRRRVGERRVVDGSGRRLGLDGDTARRTRTSGCRRVPVVRG